MNGGISPEIQNLKMATYVDFSMNDFSGVIPDTIGGMQSLQFLFLNYNGLQGRIPDSVGNLLSLKSLDLSHNFLSGSLPVSLEELQYLTLFNVSFNNLTGEIPSGGPFTNFTWESFISNKALCGAEIFHVPPCPNSYSSHSVIKNKKANRVRVTLIVFEVIVFAVSVFVALVSISIRRKKVVSSADHEDLSLITLQRISYYKLLQATDGYDGSNLLGSGGFGSLYKGTLDDGRTVAVKVFNSQFEGSFKSFEKECQVLRNLYHRNLTKIISICSNHDFKALILEYMPNGSLDKWLYSHNYFLNITQRLDILIDVASALQYLHCESFTQVIHCDLKPNNILLDEDMVAHLTDFGVAKSLGQENSVTYTKTMATLGYLAPEYGMEGLVSTKCDVYSFGIIIMEIFTRKSPSDEMFAENLSLRNWVTSSLPDRLADVIDENLMRATEDGLPEIMGCISSVMEVALNCTKDIARERNNIEDVLAILKKIKLQLLPLVQGKV